MEITGKIIAVLPVQQGEGRNGTWKAQDYVLETMDQYPKKVCFNLFGAKIEQFPIAIDELVTVSFDIDSREYNGRWFTSIRAWKIDKNVSAPAASEPQSVVNAPTFDPTASANESGTDLPF